MHLFKKTSLILAAIFALSFPFSACNTQANESTSSYENSDIVSEESSSWEESDSNETSVSIEEDSSSEEIIDEELLIMQQTVDLAYDLAYGETLGSYTLTGTITNILAGSKFNADLLIEGREDFPIYLYNLQGETADLMDGDIITVFGKIKNYKGTVEYDSALLMGLIHHQKPSMGEDPYANMSESEFYANYTPATSNTDAYFRSLHGFMSGELTVPNQAPTLAKNQPKDGKKFIRNSEMQFRDDGKEYVVVDCYGNEAFRVYRNGAYITLEEVAAFVYAFGTYPANYTTSKNTSPRDSVWGEYLRVNHTSFSGSTTKYPYEPELPNITGCGGTLNYFEMDIGTTGTDCDPSYPSVIYNNGTRIERGAARIVYGKKDLNKNGVYEIGEHHVFYTYNHYNDFQEYLNYQGGWGEMFGNITGGGTISSKYDYNPTDYVQIALTPLSSYANVSLANFHQNYYGV